MNMPRRRFNATLAGIGAFARAVGAESRTLSAARIVAPPSAIHAFWEDGSGKLNRDGTRWTGDGITVRTEPSATGAGMRTYITSPGKRLLRVRLHWSGALPPDYRFLGDAWERGYGDLAWRGLEPERPMPWYFLAANRTGVLCCGVKINPGAFCFWQTDPSGVTLWLDVRNGGSGVELGDRALVAAVIVAQDYRGQTPFSAARQFCKRIADHGLSMPQPLYGGNNWYYAYGNSSADDIRSDAGRVASWAPSSPNRPFMVIDDGWSPNRTTGPWSHGNARFPDMPALAADILRMNVRPGIWFRPLTTRETVPDDWLLRGAHEGRMLTLDPTVSGVQEKIRSDVHTLTAWGYQLLKHDFSTYDLLGRWGFQMGAELTHPGWHFADRSRTNAEIFRAFYQLLRDAAGGTALLGCNTVGHFAAGLFEAQRTGDDTSGRDWARTRKMGVNTLAFRSVQNGIFFDTDADCVGLTRDIPWKLNRQWLDLLALSGTPLFVSAAPDAVGAEQQAALREAFARAAEQQPTGEPLDWLDTSEPGHWRLRNRESRFDWFSGDSSLPL
jgi:alpha-galactosidase